MNQWATNNELPDLRPTMIQPTLFSTPPSVSNTVKQGICITTGFMKVLHVLYSKCSGIMEKIIWLTTLLSTIHQIPTVYNDINISSRDLTFHNSHSGRGFIHPLCQSYLLSYIPRISLTCENPLQIQSPLHIQSPLSIVMWLVNLQRSKLNLISI